MYPRIRPSRGRRTGSLRRLSEETRIHRDDLILPLFVVSGQNRKEPIESMPDVYRLSCDPIVELAGRLQIPAVLLFGVPEQHEKDDNGQAALDPDGIVPYAVKKLKAQRPDLAVITDVCVCGYLSHGHCGIVDEHGAIDAEPTLNLLAQMAAVHAEAGADMVAPSAMTDGQVKMIRQMLDEHELGGTAIMSYSTKFASSFYGPFRDAAQSSPKHGDRRAYQLPVANRKEAIREALLDEAEGADWLMVKPGLPYLDVLRDVCERSLLPVAAYQVSGEYSMLKHASLAGSLQETPAVMESLLCLKRAGAAAIITYYAEQACRWLDDR